MKKNKLPIIAISLFLSTIFLNADGFNLCENGDLIFRTGVVYFGHTGIYCDWNEAGNPQFPQNQNIVEAPGSIHGVWEKNLLHFYQTNTFWGARMRMPSPLCQQRDSILIFVRDKTSMYNGQGCPYHFRGGYKGGPIVINGDTIETYRCDGLVEAAYELIGLDIVYDNHWWELSPLAQYNIMEEAEGIGPALCIFSPQDGDTIETKQVIHFAANDGPMGSGIDRVDIIIDSDLKKRFDCDCEGAMDTTYVWDTFGVNAGLHRIEIISYDRAGNMAQEERVVYKGKAPWVIWTMPHNAASDVAVYKDKLDVFIVFSKPMDRASTEGAISITPSLPHHFIWNSDNEGVTIKFEDDLEFFSKYTITITDAATDTSGLRLDGDANGEPGGNCVFDFTTRLPELSVDPTAFATPIEAGSGGDFGISIKNNEQRTLAIELEDNVANPGGWTTNSASGNFNLDAYQTLPLNYSVFNEAAESNLFHIFNLIYDNINLDNAEHSYSPFEEKQPDHPDEGPVVNPQYPTPWYLDSESEIGILLNGFYDGVGHLLGRYKLNTCLLKPEDMKILGEPNRTIDSLSVLIIPSGGLNGLDNFAHIKQAFENFANHGGIIICLTQQYGYDLDLLPSAPEAFGWREDQSCWQASGYFSDWDVILSGQRSYLINAHVDGFFVDAPMGSKVIMKRRISGLPELLYYWYGAGTVLVCGLYTDWAYGQSQWCMDEVVLVRDILTWAMDTAKPISEYYQGESINLDIPVHYYLNADTASSNKAIVKVYSPDRDSIYTEEHIFSPPLLPGDYTTLNIDNYAAPQYLGVYPITYCLFQDSILLQEEKLGQRFAVKKDIPVGEYVLGDFGIWAIAESEQILYGSEALYDIFVRNSTESLLHSKIIIGIHEEGGHRWQVIDSILVDIPADSTMIIPYSRELLKSTSTYFGIFHPDDKDYSHFLQFSICRCQKGVWIMPARCKITCNTGKSLYLSNEQVRYDIAIQSSVTSQCSLFVRLLDDQHNCHDSLSIITILDSTQSFTYSDSFLLGDQHPNGRLKIQVQTFLNSKEIGIGRCYFFKREALLNCEFIPDSILSGQDTMKLVAQIAPDSVIVPSSILQFSLLCPTYKISETLSYDSICNNETLLAPIEIPLDSMRLGNYQFIYSIISLDTLIGQYEFRNAMSFGILSFPSLVHWKDTLSIDFKLKNTGDFEFPVWMIAEIEKPEGNFLDSALIAMDIGTDTIINFQTEIDSGTPDDHYNVWLRIRHGKFTKEKKRTYHVQMRPPEIVITTDTTHYFSNDTASIILFNTGDLVADVRLTEVYLQDLQVNQFPLDTARFTIPPKDFAFHKFAIPYVMTGPYYHFVKGTEEGYNLPIDERLYLWINGIEANIALKTSKDIYLPTDSVRAQIDFLNGNFPFDGEMELSIAPAGLYPGDTTFIAGDEDMWPIYNWSSPGCTLIAGHVSLMGKDKLFEIDNWGIEPDWGRDGEGITSKEEMVLALLKAKRNKERGSEPIRYAALASYDGKLYAAITTDIRRKILGPYPNFYSSPYDLSTIASISQFAMDESYFYVADIDSEYVYRVLRSSGGIEKQWKASQPVGIGVHGNELYVLDGLNHLVVKSSLSGDTIISFGEDSLSNPTDLAIDDSGTIFVCDIAKSKVFVFDSNGNCTGVRVLGNFAQIAVDEVGYLYGADLDSMKLAEFDENGVLIQHYGGVLPDEIAVCGGLIHSAKIYTTQWIDVLMCNVLKNYGRFGGYSTTKEFVWIPATYVTDFIPTQNEQSGSIDWYFSFFSPVMEDPDGEWFPIDSLGYFNLEEHTPPIYRAVLRNSLEGISPEVEQFELHYVTRRYGAVVWEDSLEMKYLPNDSVFIENNAGVFADTGEFVFWGDIALDNGQRYPSPQMHNFYIKQSLLSFGMRTDREVYYPDEDILLTSTVVNNGDTTASSITFAIFKREENVFDTLISLEPHSSCTLSTMLSDSGSFVLNSILSAGLDTLRAYKAVEVETPPLMFSTTSPCSVNHEPFQTVTEITNWWTREVNVVLRTICGDTQFVDSFTLLPEEAKELSHLFEISKTETLFIELLHPFTVIKTNEIRFGERISICIDSIITSEVNPIIPYEVVNTGEFDCIFELTLIVADSNGVVRDSITSANLLPISDTLRGEWNPTMGYGDYTLHWTANPESSTIVLSGGAVPITITEPNQVVVDSIELHPQCDSLGQLCFDVFVSNNSANGFVGNIRLLSDFIYETKALELEPRSKDTVQFLSNAILQEGFYGLTGKILQNGYIIHEYNDSLEFTAAVSIESLPGSLTFGMGDSATISVTTCNSGTAIGEQQLYFDFREFGNEIRAISLIPGEQRIDSFQFYFPEDLEELTYYASIWLGNDEFVIPVRILGYKIHVNGYLNQFNYAPGDTVQLALEVDNKNERILKGFCVTNYNGEPKTQDFLLSGYANNIDFSNPEFIKSTGDTGQYVSSIIWCGNFDSVSIEAEGTGGFDFLIRTLGPDTVHCSPWHAESTLIGQSNGLQFRASFFDPLSNLERVHIACFDSAGVTDTTIETFSPPGITRTSIYPFDEETNLMFYGVYTSTGRGLWLNTVYVFAANDTCNIVTDKQRYDLSDTVKAFVQSPFSGMLRWNVGFYPMGELSDSLDIDSLSNQFEFAVPEELATGTYEIEFRFDIGGDTLQRFSSMQPFDVMGYQVSVYECRLDTNEYPPGDSMDVRFKLQSPNSIPVIAKLQFMQHYQWYEGLLCTLNIDSGFNVIDLSLQIPDLHRGTAFLNYSFFKDSIFLAHSSEGFMVYVPDSIPPIAHFIEKPQNTYNPHIDYIVRIFAQDETRLFDTLFFHNGYIQQGISHDSKHGDTLIYKIPSQPRGTHTAYYVAVADTFGNMTRLPDTDFEQFWVIGQLPPSDCATDTIDRAIHISWSAPSEFLKYHSGYPYESKQDTFALRITPQFIPGILTELDIYVAKGIPDTALLTVEFYSCDKGKPGIQLGMPQEIQIMDTDPHWINAPLDSIELNEEMFIILSGEDISFFGDRNACCYRTLLKETGWAADTLFGNLLCHTRCFYEPESIFYRVLKEDSLQYTLVADSLSETSFADSNVYGERCYRYLIKTHYMIPNLNATSQVMEQVFDYTPPQFGDSFSVIETDSSFILRCEIVDGIGISTDSLNYAGIDVSHDSIASDTFWYTIPKIEQPIPYYLVASDSAQNSSRNPDSGFFYISPQTHEGFSGHIAIDTTWASDVILNGDVWIDPGVTLSIEAGVHVLVVPHFDAQEAGIDTALTEIIVQGNLQLFANESLPVVFTSYATQQQSGDWYGIRFEQEEKEGFPIAAMEIDFEANVERKFISSEKRSIPEEELASPCPVEMELNRKAFEKTKKVWREFGKQKGFITDVSNTRIEYAKRGLVYQRPGFHAVQNAALKHNADCGIAIEEHLSWTIVENTEIENSNTGIAGIAPLWIWDGSIKDCDGVGVSYAGWDGFAYGTDISLNGVGILSSGCSFPLIWNCTLNQNGIGLYAEANSRPFITQSSIIASDSLGIYISDNAKPNLGGRGHNHIHGSGCYDVFNNTPNRISAKNNYWGTMDLDSIEAHIFDYYDNDSLGVVLIEPLWDGDQIIAGAMSEGHAEAPLIFDLKTPSPNPFSLATTITYSIPQSGYVSLRIYDITGKCIRILEDGVRQCGLHTITWDGTNHHSRKVANGIYFIRLASNDRIALKKILIVK